MMTKRPRWLSPLLADGAAPRARLPWARGLRRAAGAARRRAGLRLVP